MLCAIYLIQIRDSCFPLPLIKSVKFNSKFNQIDAQNLFHNKLYFMPLHVSSTCAHHQEVKIALHSLWYHHIYRWSSRVQVDRGLHIGC